MRTHGHNKIFVSSEARCHAEWVVGFYYALTEEHHEVAFLHEIPAFGYQPVVKHQLVGIGKGIFLFFIDKLIGIAAHVGDRAYRLDITQLHATWLAMEEKKTVFIDGASGYCEVLIA